MKRKISVVGLGYVGLPVAVAFGLKHEVIAFDVNEKRISDLKNGFDKTGEVSKAELQSSELVLTTNSERLSRADFHIIAVPTPVDASKRPDFSALIAASELIGKQLKKGDIVVYESTVYPGATEEVCAPVLELQSGLVCGLDFFIGYSPERINPGDKEHSFTNITKVVSGQTPEILDIVAETYASVVTAGVFRASTIKVAEAAKVIENTQRDLNIAFVNELAIIFEKMGINTNEVLEAAGTKWNFLKFKPGLVGGHCIGVDPYYLTYKAEKLGYHPDVILAGRRINDGMGKYVAERTIKGIINKKMPINSIKILVMGLTFKENCNDIRNTKVIDIIDELKTYGVNVSIHDPLVDPIAAKKLLGVDLVSYDSLQAHDVVILAVPHNEFFDAAYSKVISEADLLVDIKDVLTHIKDKVTI
jgi:UDP-N-acetyl-D-glucosamine/UDP-N-acetyl-D-galactosamine dehydrogenase